MFGASFYGVQEELVAMGSSASDPVLIDKLEVCESFFSVCVLSHMHVLLVTCTPRQKVGEIGISPQSSLVGLAVFNWSRLDWPSALSSQTQTRTFLNRN